MGSRGEAALPSNSPPSNVEDIKQALAVSITQDPKPKKKICCACPNTKRLRDECIMEHGEAACKKWIEAHLQCLRAEGFRL